MAITFTNIGLAEPSTVTNRLAAVTVTRGSTSEQQEILTIGDPESSAGLARVLNAVRLRYADGARRHMERLVKGSSEYLAARSPELVSQKVRWGDPG